MKRVWLILNRGSRAVADDWEAKLTLAFEARGTDVVGITDFPSEALPTPAELDAADADVTAVAAGDGTINATARALEDWAGVLLVLPGGTMNLLAKALHGDALPEAIVAAVNSPPAAKPIPTVDADGQRAIVGVIVGPAAAWVHAREAVRKGRWGRLLKLVRMAYSRTLSRAVRVVEARGRRSRGYRAVFLHPGDEVLTLVKVRAAGWTDGVRLGFTYLTGTWETARGIEKAEVQSVRFVATGPISALFDGEPVRLGPNVTMTLGKTRLRFAHTI